MKRYWHIDKQKYQEFNLIDEFAITRRVYLAFSWDGWANGWRGAGSTSPGDHHQPLTAGNSIGSARVTLLLAAVSLLPCHPSLFTPLFTPFSLSLLSSLPPPCNVTSQEEASRAPPLCAHQGPPFYPHGTTRSDTLTRY